MSGSLGTLSLAISTFPAPATTSTMPTRQEVSWPALVAVLTRHERRTDKDGRGWSPAIYRPGTTRKSENVLEWSCAVGDLDHHSAEDYQALKARLADLDLAYVIYSTFQSTPEAPRYRVVVPLTQPVPADRWGEVWQQLNAYLFAGQNDPQTKDASRMFFLPACPPDALPFAEHRAGEALDPDTLPPAPAPRVDGQTAPGRGALAHLGYLTLDFIANGAPVGQQRVRALAATRAYLAAGYSAEATAEKVWQGLANAPCGNPDDPWTYDHALAFANDLADREPPRLRDGAVSATAEPSPNGSRAERPDIETAVLPNPRLVLSTDIPPADEDPADGLWGPFVPDEPSVVLISGETSAGKTMFGFNLARALGSDEEYLGLTPTRPVKVLMLDLETPDHLRRAMLDSIGRHERWAFYTPTGSLENPAEQQALIDTAVEWGAAVIFMDSLMDVWSVRDEDDNAEATRQMLALRAIARATGTRIIAQHHQGQGNPKAKFRARGATARVDRADVAMNLDEIADDVRQLSIVKSRFGTRGQSITFRFAADLGYELVHGEDEASPSAYTAVSTRVLAAVSSRLPRKELGQRLPDVADRTMNEVLTRLVRAQKLRRCGPDGRPGKGHYERPEGNGSSADYISGRPAELPKPAEADVSSPPERTGQLIPFPGAAEADQAGNCEACGDPLPAGTRYWCDDCRSSAAAALNGQEDT